MVAGEGRKRGTTRARVCTYTTDWRAMHTFMDVGFASARTYVVALHIELARRIEY